LAAQSPEYPRRRAAIISGSVHVSVKNEPVSWPAASTSGPVSVAAAAVDAGVVKPLPSVGVVDEIKTSEPIPSTATHNVVDGQHTLSPLSR
jgi:hypothetical protein